MIEEIKSPSFKSSNVSFDLRVVGQESEIKDFINLCKVIQQIGRNGSNRTIKLTVDGDGSGRLSFYGIDRRKDLLADKYTDFNSSGIDVDNEDTLDMWIGE